MSLADVTDPRFTAGQLATVAAFESAPTPPEVREAALREALELIDRDGCESFTGATRCLDPHSGKTRGARYGADRWCDPCIARAAVAAYRATQDGGAEEAVRRVEALADELDRDARTDRETVLWVTNAFRAALAPQAER